ncbi:MAG: GNAT family N-acetyltransferase [Candidatus Bathyarchaeota archaeon]|nr:MAG: GNAT family N-acetyltransferase [Candidatus Bathyarchaeota archaeon]
MEIEKGRIHYRRANINDIEVLIDYRVRCLNELHNHPEDDETKILRKTLREYFCEAIPANDFVAWLAEFKGRIAATSGMVLWKIPPRYGGVESGKFGYILNFYTIPEVRRKGVGTRLLKELIKEARSSGLRYLHLHAYEYGIDLYRKAGFAEPLQVGLELRLE